MDWTTWTKRGQQSWPPVHPDYVLLPVAMETIARNAFGDEWTGGEFTFDPAHMIYGVPAPVHAFASEDGEPDGFQLRNHGDAVRFWAGLSGIETPTYHGWKLAYDRFAWHLEHGDDLIRRKAEACRFIQKLAMAGTLVVYARNAVTGEMDALGANLWNCDADIAEARFSRSRVNPKALIAPFVAMAPIPGYPVHRGEYLAEMTAWLFVTKENVAALVAAPDAAPAGVALPTPETKAARGWRIADAPLVQEMHQLFTSGAVSSPTAAAAQLVKEGKVKGAGDVESKIKRLQRRYRETFEVQG